MESIEDVWILENLRDQKFFFFEIQSYEILFRYTRFFYQVSQYVLQIWRRKKIHLKKKSKMRKWSLIRRYPKSDREAKRILMSHIWQRFRWDLQRGLDILSKILSQSIKPRRMKKESSMNPEKKKNPRTFQKLN